jgi:hypothetical protein
MTAKINAPYTTGVYRSNSDSPLPPPKWAEDANRSGNFDTHLAFGHYANLEPATETSNQLQGEEQYIYQRQHKQGKEEEAYCDAKRWRFQNSSKIPQIILACKMMCFFFIWVLWGTGLIVEFLPNTGRKDFNAFLILVSSLLVVALMISSLALYMSGKRAVHYLQIIGFFTLSISAYSQTGALWGSDKLHIYLWFGTFLYFLGAVGFNCVLWVYSNLNTHDGSEFNRLDGMLRFKRRFRRLFVAPFEEFDPVLQLLPSGYGSHDYALWLHHRYTDNKICLATKVHSLGLDQANTLAFWDCLQRYMDITQPLPDLPVLEQSRHLDPVTVAHDVKTGRNPRRWRDQSEKGWITGGQKALAKQLQEYPWQKEPCIVKARIDPSLTIEAYYRAQEAKGIHATPKADDFDNIHRS